MKEKIVYESLNKIVDFNDLIVKNEKITKIKNNNIDKTINKIIEEDPIIYIYNSHDTEKYSIPYISDHSITPTVKIASYMLKDHLNDLGISSYVEENSISDYLKKYNLSYKGCYEASRYYLKNAKKKYDFKIYIDLHRDSVKHKYTLYEKDGKRYAKILFVLTTKHDNYKKNEEFVNELNSMIESKYDGLSRGIMKRDDVIFNQDLSPNAILLELGGVDNTIEELNNTLKVFAKILKEYLNKEET